MSKLKERANSPFLPFLVLFHRSDGTHLHWWWWSSLPSLLIQMLTSFRNTFMHTPRNVLPGLWGPFSSVKFTHKVNRHNTVYLRAIKKAYICFKNIWKECHKNINMAEPWGKLNVSHQRNFNAAIFLACPSGFAEGSGQREFS